MNYEKSISEIYAEMENELCNYEDLKKFRRKLFNLRDSISDYKVHKKIYQQIKFEIETLTFIIENGEITPLFGIIPDFYKEQQRDQLIKYIESRDKNSKNPFLKLRYSFILWKLQNNNKYVDFIKHSKEYILFCKDKIYENNENYHHSMKDAIINLYKINVSTEYNIDQAKELILSTLFDSKINYFLLVTELLNLVISEKKIFKKSDLYKLDEFCWDYAKEIKNKRETLYILEKGQKIENRLQTNTFNWNMEIAKLYEELINEGNELNAIYFCQKSLEFYKKANEEEKIKELTLKIEELKKSKKYFHMEVPIDRLFSERITTKLINMIHYNTEELLNYLIYCEDEFLIGGLNNDDENYKIFQKNAPLLSSVRTDIFDSNNNFRRTYKSKEEKIQYANYRNYMYQIMYIRTYLMKLSIFSYENKILTFRETEKYLKNLKINNKENFFDLIYPAINSYIKSIEQYLINPNSKNEHTILFMDSIINKIELIIRTICENNKIIITKAYKKDGYLITEQHNLKNILDNDDFKNLVSTNDFDFLKFVLIEPGLNLRNIISHGLDLNVYSFENSNLLLLCFLRLVKYLK